MSSVELPEAIKAFNPALVTVVEEQRGVYVPVITRAKLSDFEVPAPGENNPGSILFRRFSESYAQGWGQLSEFGYDVPARPRARLLGIRALKSNELLGDLQTRRRHIRGIGATVIDFYTRFQSKLEEAGEIDEDYSIVSLRQLVDNRVANL